MKHTHTQARAQTPDCFRFERADQAIIVQRGFGPELGGQRRQQTEEEKEEDRRRREATPPSTCK